MLKNKDDKVVLTPAQIDFLSENIEQYDTKNWSVSVAGKAGSDRKFIRILPPKYLKIDSLILVLWDPRDEDWNNFFDIHKEISSSINLFPQIYARNDKHGFILEEDCGRFTLKKKCESNPSLQNIKDYYELVLSSLVQLQNLDIVSMKTVSNRTLDYGMYLWETRYFAAFCVGDYCGLDALLDDAWQNECNHLATFVASLPLTLIHRDFQSENIMIHDNYVKFVDFQGARLGAGAYDIASLLYDPYATYLSEELREHLFDHYCDITGSTITKRDLTAAALQRCMQACGAYANLSLHKGKQKYRKFIPIGLYLLSTIVDMIDGYPTIKRVINKCRARCL